MQLILKEVDAQFPPYLLTIRGRLQLDHNYRVKHHHMSIKATAMLLAPCAQRIRRQQQLRLASYLLIIMHSRLQANQVHQIKYHHRTIKAVVMLLAP